MKHDTSQLPQVAFSILLALSLRPRHGYEIMQQVEDDSNGRIKLGPGALYGSIKTLCEHKLIEESLGHEHSSRRKYYQLTDIGRARLSSELQYFSTAVKLGSSRGISTTFQMEPF